MQSIFNSTPVPEMLLNLFVTYRFWFREKGWAATQAASRGFLGWHQAGGTCSLNTELVDWSCCLRSSGEYPAVYSADAVDAGMQHSHSGGGDIPGQS